MLQGKVAIVTGAASGIGRASALALAEQGAAIVVADLDASGAQKTASSIEEASGLAVAAPGDVTNDLDMAALVDLAVRRYGRLDIAVNAAGGGDRRGRIPTLGEDDFDAMIGLNLKSMFLAMRHQLARLVAQETGGSIINISSTAGLRGVPNGALYSAAKHGVIGLTRCAALDHGDANIRVNAICPGAIQTPQFDRVLNSKFNGAEREAALAATATRYPLQRIGAPQEVADMVVWLASDRSSYVTGQALAIDGGSTA